MTQPDWVGALLPELVCDVQQAQDATLPERVVVALLVLRIQERERAAVPLTRLKNITIFQLIELLRRHFTYKYQSRDKGPRLLQLAMYAMYQCLFESCSRYERAQLRTLESLRAANRKSGSLGDVDIAMDDRPFEAVEVKFNIAIVPEHVQDAIEKVKTTDLRRYYILSTSGVAEDQAAETKQRCDEFYHRNGCEIIVNGIYPTLAYYMRLLGSADRFLTRYLDLVALDQELTFEHREVWNQITSLPDAPSS